MLRHLHFYLKSKTFIFGSFFVLKLVTCFLFEMARFSKEPVLRLHWTLLTSDIDQGASLKNQLILSLQGHHSAHFCKDILHFSFGLRSCTICPERIFVNKYYDFEVQNLNLCPKYRWEFSPLFRDWRCYHHRKIVLGDRTLRPGQYFSIFKMPDGTAERHAGVHHGRRFANFS